MKMLPKPSTATPPADWRSRAALVAGPPSPEKPKVPLPTTLIISPAEKPEGGVHGMAASAQKILRMLKKSAMKRFPAASTATLLGITWALVAGPPSPLKLQLAPVPAPAVVPASTEM